MSCSDRCAWWMLIASSSQIPRGTATRSPRPASVIAASTSSAVRGFVSGSPRSRQAASRAEEISLAGTAQPLNKRSH